MADLVSSISGATGMWGQPAQQDPESETTTSESTTTETTSSTSSTGTTSGSATTANSTPTYSVTAEVSPMPQRLRDLIVQQRSMNSPAATTLRTFANQMASDRIAAEEVRVEEKALVERTKQQIIEQASIALVAQANQTRDSVRALLEV